MTDLIELLIKAGDGGRGAISFRREKYVPKGGPDGGDGGRGGDVVLVASKHLSSLNHLAGLKQVVADTGGRGEPRQKSGRDARPVQVKVPVGTSVWLKSELVAATGWRRRGLEPIKRSQVKFEQYFAGFDDDPSLAKVEATIQASPSWQQCDELLVELLEDGQQALICQGGFGGRGNTQFKSAKETTPRRAEKGSLGEQKRVALELKLLADVGLVGFPSVGKSTLLSVLTSARPKIAAYPFTTLEPNLGIMTAVTRSSKARLEEGDQSLVLADLPGLIEGASEGKGLGHQFLRHVEHCQVLGIVLALEDIVAVDAQSTATAKAKLLVDQYHKLMWEMKAHHPALVDKAQVIIINKIDLLPPAEIPKIFTLMRKKIHNSDSAIIAISGMTGQGLAELRTQLLKLVNKAKN